MVIGSKPSWPRAHGGAFAAMEVTLADLQRTYADKTDDDLLHLHGRGTLTDVAYQALEAELTSRGIAVPSRPAEAES